jgi:hypothetical protein
MRYFLATGLVAGMLAGIAHAQQAEPAQTVEGAHVFFDSLAKSRLMKVDFWDAVYKEWNVKDQENAVAPGQQRSWSKWRYGSSTITSFAIKDKNPCLSKVSYDMQLAPHIAPEPGARWSHTIVWSDVKSVELTGSSIRIQNLVDVLNPVGFTFASRELAVRGHYAAEFLKFKCDKLPVTGF